MAQSSDRVRPEYRIRRTFPRPNADLYANFKDYPTAAISDAFRKRQTLPPEIKAVYSPAPKIVGPAVTVLATPGDEILALKAIELAKPGDVIVVAGAKSDRFSFWGGIMSLMAKERGVAGLVTDGLIRDVADMERMQFPVYAAGVTPMAPVMDVPPGELNLPLAFGNVVIHPGDLIVADRDGVVVVPQADIAAVDAAVKARLAKEAEWEREIRANKTMILKQVVDDLLASRTVEYVDD